MLTRDAYIPTALSYKAISAPTVRGVTSWTVTVIDSLSLEYRAALVPCQDSPCYTNVVK